MLYNTPVLKRAAALAATKKTSASKCPACVESILSPGMLLSPAEHSSSIMSQLFPNGVEKCTPDPDTAFQGSHLQGTDLVPLTPSLLWWFRRNRVELGLESQRKGVGRSWSVPESSCSDTREMLSRGAETGDLGEGSSAGRATSSDETGLDRGCRICKLFH